jgi:hypothetical protein
LRGASNGARPARPAVEYGAYFLLASVLAEERRPLGLPARIAAPPALNATPDRIGVTATSASPRPSGWFRTTPNFRLEDRGRGHLRPASNKARSSRRTAAATGRLTAVRASWSSEIDWRAEGDFGAGLDLGLLASGAIRRQGFAVEASITGASQGRRSRRLAGQSPGVRQPASTASTFTRLSAWMHPVPPGSSAQGDAVYLRPTRAAAVARLGPSKLTARLAAVVSFAMEAASAPGPRGASPASESSIPLGVHGSRDEAGLRSSTVLFPSGGLDNPEIEAIAAKLAHPVGDPLLRATPRFVNFETTYLHPSIALLVTRPAATTSPALHGSRRPIWHQRAGSAFTCLPDLTMARSKRGRAWRHVRHWPSTTMMVSTGRQDRCGEPHRQAAEARSRLGLSLPDFRHR